MAREVDINDGAADNIKEKPEDDDDEDLARMLEVRIRASRSTKYIC